MSTKSETERIRQRQIYRVLSTLLLSLFVAMISVTIVGTALPTIVSQLNGSETHYTWIVTAELLSSTAATPIIGRLGDIYNKKRLLLVSVSIFTVGSLLSGCSSSPEALILFRVVQGIGMGGQMAMIQTVIASIIPPRERGKYNGFMGSVITVATVSGPLLGGFIVAGFGWRWCLWIAVPFSIFVIVVLAKYLKVPEAQAAGRKVDYLGSTSVTIGVSLLLIILSLGGSVLPWASPLTIGLLVLGVLAIVFFVFIEMRTTDPVIPLRLLKSKLVRKMAIGSVLVGLAFNSPPVFLTQYFQIGLGFSPAKSGLAILPMMLGSFLSSTIIGILVSRRGRWKGFVVGGLLTMTIGAEIIVVSNHHSLLLILGMFTFGAGQGACLQNMVLAVQNVVPLKDIGASTAMITFIRSLGSSIGVQLCGFLFSFQLAISMRRNFTGAGLALPDQLSNKHGSMDFSGMDQSVVSLIRTSYGDSMWIIFSCLALASFLAFLCVSRAKGSVLRNTVDLDQKSHEVKSVEVTKAN